MPAGERARRAGGARRPQLADLIDLELQLQRDRARPPEELARRDVALAAELAPRQLAGRELLLGWLDLLRERSAGGLASIPGAPPPGPFPGRQAERLRGAVGALLLWLGAFSGLAGVGGWLLAGTGEPVHALRLWLAVVGSQLALLLLFCARVLLFALRGGAAFAGFSGAVTWLPAAAAALLARTGALPRGLLGELGELRRLDWLYGRLRFWLLAALSQGFALGFNAGALAAFVVIPYLDDPAFGWRSRLFEAADVERAVRVIALPWSTWWPAALPSLEAIQATRFSSLDPRFGGGPAGPAAAAPQAWAAWWPFLAASLLGYGLLPRLVVWGFARAAAARALARAPLDHADAARLRERLERPPLALGAAPGAPAAGDAAPPASEPSSDTADFAGRPLQLLCWAGVPFAAELLRARLAACTGARVAPDVLRVGAVERSGDALALSALRALGPGGAAALCVEAWEPPVADYTDFVRDAREALGPQVPLLIWPVQREGGEAEGAREAQRALWSRQLARLGDPWLRVAGWPAQPAPAPAP